MLHGYRHHLGVTIIELSVTLVIVSLLVFLAYPSYKSYNRQNHRSEAVMTLINMQLAQEKFRATHSTYGNLSEVWAGIATTEHGYYALSIDEISSTGYKLTAKALGDQTQDRAHNQSCETLILSLKGAVESKTPEGCW